MIEMTKTLCTNKRLWLVVVTIALAVIASVLLSRDSEAQPEDCPDCVLFESWASGGGFYPGLGSGGSSGGVGQGTSPGNPTIVAPVVTCVYDSSSGTTKCEQPPQPTLEGSTIRTETTETPDISTGESGNDLGSLNRSEEGSGRGRGTGTGTPNSPAPVTPAPVTPAPVTTTPVNQLPTVTPVGATSVPGADTGTETGTGTESGTGTATGTATGTPTVTPTVTPTTPTAQGRRRPPRFEQPVRPGRRDGKWTTSRYYSSNLPYGPHPVIKDYPVPVGRMPTAPATVNNFAKNFRVNRPDFPKGLPVHHSIPQRYQDMFAARGINVHDLFWLRGVSNITHDTMHNQWNAWHRQIQRQHGRSPTVEEVLSFRQQMEVRYEYQMYYPVLPYGTIP